MIPEIGTLKKLAASNINRGKLPAITSALKSARDLTATLEPKSDSEHDTEEFEDCETELESALDDLECACDELELAEEKDERDDAIDQIESALSGLIANLEAIMEVGVVNEVDQKSINLELGAQLKEIKTQQGSNLLAALETWTNDSPSEAIKRARKRAVQCFLKMMQQATSARANP